MCLLWQGLPIYHRLAIGVPAHAIRTALNAIVQCLDNKNMYTTQRAVAQPHFPGSTNIHAGFTCSSESPQPSERGNTLPSGHLDRNTGVALFDEGKSFEVVINTSFIITAGRSKNTCECRQCEGSFASRIKLYRHLPDCSNSKVNSKEPKLGKDREPVQAWMSATT